MQLEQSKLDKEECGTSVAGEEDPGAAVETSIPRRGDEAVPETMLIPQPPSSADPVIAPPTPSPEAPRREQTAQSESDEPGKNDNTAGLLKQAELGSRPEPGSTEP